GSDVCSSDLAVLHGEAQGDSGLAQVGCECGEGRRVPVHTRPQYPGADRLGRERPASAQAEGHRGVAGRHPSQFPGDRVHLVVRHVAEEHQGHVPLLPGHPAQSTGRGSGGRHRRVQDVERRGGGSDSREETHYSSSSGRRSGPLSRMTSTKGRRARRRTFTPRLRPRSMAALTAMVTLTVPPTTMLTAGPNRSASTPTIGAPMGATPRNTSMYIAMTRPRICGSTFNWK